MMRMETQEVIIGLIALDTSEWVSDTFPTICVFGYYSHNIFMS